MRLHNVVGYIQKAYDTVQKYGPAVKHAFNKFGMNRHLVPAIDKLADFSISAINKLGLPEHLKESIINKGLNMIAPPGHFQSDIPYFREHGLDRNSATHLADSQWYQQYRTPQRQPPPMTVRSPPQSNAQFGVGGSDAGIAPAFVGQGRQYLARYDYPGTLSEQIERSKQPEASFERRLERAKRSSTGALQGTALQGTALEPEHVARSRGKAKLKEKVVETPEELAKEKKIQVKLRRLEEEKALIDKQVARKADKKIRAIDEKIKQQVSHDLPPKVAAQPKELKKKSQEEPLARKPYTGKQVAARSRQRGPGGRFASKTVV